MQFLAFRPLAIVLVLIVLTLTNCGGSSNGARMLLSVTVSPASADAQQSAGGQVQFTATGTYNLPPTTVTPLTNVVWTVNRPAFSGLATKASDPGIDANGMAQCSATSQGTSTINATAAKDPSQPVSLSNEVAGSAHLMCP